MDQGQENLLTIAKGKCPSCEARGRMAAVEYSYDHPEHYDGVSEHVCLRCRARYGRWTGRRLTGGATEPRLGEERPEIIAEEQARHCPGTQPR